MATTPRKVIDTETYQEVEKTYHHVSDALYQLCDNSSSGLFYVQEDIQMSVPKIVRARNILTESKDIVDSCLYGTQFTIETIHSLSGLSTFKTSSDRIKQLCTPK